MRDPLPIPPIRRPLAGDVKLPGSKSITNRALILAALADGTTRLEGALFSRDTRIMLQALDTLGIPCHAEEARHHITVHGTGGHIPAASARIDVGNAGTAARFLTALLALRPGGDFELDGDAAMRTRPMHGLLHALEQLEATDITCHGQPGHFPFRLRGKGFTGGSAEVDASASSQILSALLLAAPAGNGTITLHCPRVRPAYVTLTQNVREAFGATAPTAGSENDGHYELPPIRYRPPSGGTYAIEPDLTAAGYFFALTVLHGGTLRIPNLPPTEPLQNDARFAEVLQHHGLGMTPKNGAWRLHRATEASIERGHREIDFEHFSDTFLTYAALAPLLGGSVRITGIGHTRNQETDRIAGMAEELSKLGQLVKEAPDALTIQAQPGELAARALDARQKGELLEIDTYEDHRFAMSFGVLGTYDLLRDGEPWLAVRNPGCCAKTFPGFFDTLERITAEATPAD